MAEKKQRAPTLYAIIAIKLGKGLLLLLIALGVYSLADNDLIHDYRQLLHWIHIDPERKFFAELARSIRKITPENIFWVARGTAFYSIFSFVEGYFSATGAGAAIDKAQKLPGVPPYTPAQVEAVELYRTTVSECAVDIGFEPGDIQFLNNFVMLHTRRGFEDWPDPARKRHLLRLWLRDPNGRPISKEQREGRVGTGVNIKGVQRIAPLDAEAEAA